MFNDPPPPGFANPQFYPQPQPFQSFTPTMGGYSQSNPALASLVQMGLQAMLGTEGMSMMGVSDQNLFDRYRRSYYTRQNYGIAQDMADLDRDRITNAVGTMYQMANRPFDDARQTVDFATKAWPYLAPTLSAISPELTNSLFGLRGSAADMGMSLGPISMGRIDPRTGLIGMERENVSGPNGLGTAVFKQMFDGNNYLGQPLNAGDAGRLWRELQVQGFMPGTSTLDDLHGRGSQILQKAMADKGMAGKSWEGLSAKERDDLLATPEVQSEIKAFDANKVSGTLKEWGKSIEAMRDIFGDAGMPNAPIPMLMQALRQLTSGGLSQMSQGDLSTMVRTFSSLAQSSGLGMQGATMLVQAGEAQAAQMGVDPLFSHQAGMETMSFMTAYSALGKGQSPGWGVPDINHLAQYKNQLNISARGSTIANQAGWADRISKTLGGFKEGSKAAMWLEAVRKGETTFDGNRSIIMHDAAFAEMMTEGSGQTEGMIMQGLSATHMNQGSLYNDPTLLASVQKAQAIETAQYTVAPSAAAGFGGYLKQKYGISSAENTEENQRFLGKIFSGVLMDSKRYQSSWNAEGNEAARATGMANEMYKDLKAAADNPDNPDHAQAKALMAGKTEDEVKRMLVEGGTAALESIDKQARAMHLTGYQELQAAHDTETEKKAAQVQGLAKADARMSEMMGRAGKGSILTRLTEGLESGRVTNLSDLGKLGLGGVDLNTLREVMAATGVGDEELKKFKSQIDRVRILKGKIFAGGAEGEEAEKELAAMNEKGGFAEWLQRGTEWGSEHGKDLGTATTAPGTIGAVQARILNFADKDEAEFMKRLPTLSNVKQELADFRKSDAFKNLKEGDKRISEVESLIDEANTASGVDEKRAALSEAMTKLNDVQKEQQKAEENKPINVTSTNIFIQGVKLATTGDSTIQVGGNSTTNKPA